jgi:hypothetical protein
MSRPKFDKTRVEKIIRALTELAVKHENITRILNYEYDVPDVVFVSSHSDTTKRTSYGTLRDQGGHDIFLEL